MLLGCMTGQFYHMTFVFIACWQTGAWWTGGMFQLTVLWPGSRLGYGVWFQVTDRVRARNRVKKLAKVKVTQCK